MGIMGIYGEFAERYFKAGFSPIPTKGKRAFTEGWAKYSDTQINEDEFDELLAKHSQHNVGIVLGPSSGIVGFDIDYLFDVNEKDFKGTKAEYDLLKKTIEGEQDDIKNKIIAMLPRSPCIKIGKEGKFTYFYRAAPGFKTRSIQRNTITLVDILWTGRQTVLPPSIHPDTLKPYRWINGDLTKHVEDLPELSWETVEKIETMFAGNFLPGGQKSGSTIRGRNDILKKNVFGLFRRGMIPEDCVDHLLEIDKEECSPPLFSDQSEFPKAYKTPHKAALQFAKSCYKSFKHNLKKENPSNYNVNNVNILVLDKTFLTEISADSSANIERLKLARTANGACANAANVIKVLESDFKNLIWYDEFYLKVFIATPNGFREWEEADSTEFCITLQAHYGMPFLRTEIVQKCIEAFAARFIKNEPKDWMTSLKWDKTPRLGAFFIDYMGGKDTAFVRAVSKNFFISMVARTFIPGCKVDNMVILEGAEGKSKSTALGLIAGKWFAETQESPSNKDFYQLLQGILILEIAELDSFSRADSTAVKRAVSCRVDRYRASFGRKTKDWPRRCVFAGSTNREDYVKDETGARRYWPIEVGFIDLSKIKKDRDQLFAEAVESFKNGNTWYEVPQDEALIEQSARYSGDVWDDIISTWLTAQRETTISKIATQCLNIQVSHIDRKVQMRVASVLKMLKFKCEVVYSGNSTIRVYRRES